MGSRQPALGSRLVAAIQRVTVLVPGLVVGALVATTSHGALPSAQAAPEPLPTAPMYVPDATPTGVVILLSGDGGWDGPAASLAGHLREWGALVVGVDLPALRRALASGAKPCCQLRDAVLAMAARGQQQAGVAGHRPLMLLASGAAATAAVTLAAQMPAGALAALLTLDFCPGGLASAYPRMPWVALQGLEDRACDGSLREQFMAHAPAAKQVPVPGADAPDPQAEAWLDPLRDAYLKLVTATGAAVPLPARLGDLPLTEVPAPGGSSRRLVVLLTGDGGWAGLDQAVADGLAASGVPVVALSTLQYFWRERPPEQAARDLGRIMDHYLAAWDKEQVVLVGYSFGANVLPFIVPLLPAPSRARLAGLVLMAPATHTGFEIHVADWIPGAVPQGRPLVPQIPRLAGIPVLCIYGEEEGDSLCPRFPPGAAQVVRLPGGHHFADDSATLVRQIAGFTDD